MTKVKQRTQTKVKAVLASGRSSVNMVLRRLRLRPRDTLMTAMLQVPASPTVTTPRVPQYVRLLDLPAELRDMIYDADFATIPFESPNRPRTSPALILVSHQLRQECMRPYVRRLQVADEAEKLLLFDFKKEGDEDVHVSLERLIDLNRSRVVLLKGMAGVFRMAVKCEEERGCGREEVVQGWRESVPKLEEEVRVLGILVAEMVFIGSLLP